MLALKNIYSPQFIKNRALLNSGFLAKLLLPVSALLYISGCSINPATGTPNLVLMSESREIEIGRENYLKVINSMPIYRDEKMQAYINEVGQKLAKNSDRPDIKYTFTVVDKSDINAFALPGGFIFINRGLLTYLNSEAQLAAVLAHEIAHVTARHAVRQDAAKTGAGALSFLSVLTTGSMAMGDVASLWSTAAVKGYGREMELEADQYGADYLFRSEYAPDAMIHTIGLLKDQEKFSRYRAKEEGKKAQTYHGVFASHPRNDVRLKEVIAKAGTLSGGGNAKNEARFRQEMEGIVYGQNFSLSEAQIKAIAAQKNKNTDNNRFTHSKLGFTLLFPKKWDVENKRSAIVSTSKDKSANLLLEIQKLKKPIPPGEFLRRYHGLKLLSQSENFKQHGLIGHTGVIKKEGQHDQRVAVLFQGRRAYLLTGNVDTPADGVDYDKLFKTSIHSFRPTMKQRKLPKAKRIHFVKANSNTTFKRLAQEIKIGPYSEQQLRLLNGYYPRGEPKVGEWIKIVK